MEFEGRVLKVLPVRTFTGQRGEQKSLPFVFEYFESDDQRWSDKVLLETVDHDIMRAIGQFVERGADNKGIEENGEMKMKGEIKCRCGFSHSVREWKNPKTEQTQFFNQVRLYKFELVTAQPQVTQPQQPQAMQYQQPQSPFQSPLQVENDDLPF